MVSVMLGIAQTLGWASSYYLTAIIAVPVARDLGISVTWFFGAFSLSLLLSAGLAPMAGKWVDRHGGRGILAASNLVFAAGLGLLAFTNNPVMLFVAWLVLGVAMTIGLFETAFAALTRAYGMAARGPITMVSVIGGFGGTIGWPMTAWLDANYGWRSACLVWASLQLTLGLGLHLLFVPRGVRVPVVPVQQAPSTVMPAASVQAAAPSLLDRTMLLLAYIFASVWFITTAMASHLPYILQMSGVPTASAIFACALIGPAQVTARMIEFTIGRHIHPLISARLAALAHPAAGLALLLFGPVAAILCTVLHGFGNGILTTAKGTLPLAIFGPQSYGKRQGLISIPARCTQACAPLAFGFFIEQWGVYALLVSIGLSLLILAALLALSGEERPR
ncbi:MFS transporter [Roseiarcaceae bacterium H3SJ34-1]|uniref:MFS transporter n=1 Tax=Terripilifer ovatus TaxID=3032367 RepID=UPI003AB99B05|nr:MFS transporter [Roseiarcaceae bacterium H3SJ34-1]